MSGAPDSPWTGVVRNLNTDLHRGGPAGPLASTRATRKALMRAASPPPMGGGEGARRLDIPAKRWRGKDVQPLRDRLLKSWRDSGQLMSVLLTHPDDGMNLPVHRRFPGEGYAVHWSRQQWHDFLVEELADAQPYYVTNDMTDLVVNAAAAAPAYQVFADKLPSAKGFVVFEHPYCVVPTEHLQTGQRVEIVAAFWATVPDVGGGETGDPNPGVMVVTLQDSGVLWWTQPVSDLPATRRELEKYLAKEVERSGPLAYHEEYPMPFGDSPWGIKPGHGIRNTALAAIQTMWTLMHQRITEVREEPPPRHKVERAAKRGEPRPPGVQVIDLAPRPKRRANPERQQTRDGEPSRRYERRWTVHAYGYWRDTWYPSRERHEQQWVEVPDYVKGPEGAPWVPQKTKVLREKK